MDAEENLSDDATATAPSDPVDDDTAAADTAGPSRPRSVRRRPRVVSDTTDSEDKEQGEEDVVEQEEEGEEVEEVHGLRRRKVRRRSRSSSTESITTSSDSSSSSSDSSSMLDLASEDAADTSAEGTSDQPRPAVLSKSQPKCRYSILRDMIDRELNLHHKKVFTQNRAGSLSLVTRLELAYQLEGHDGCVNSLDWNPSGSLLASGSDDLRIICWDWQKKVQKANFLSGHKANVFQSKFLPLAGDAHIVSSSRDGQVRLTELGPSGEARVSRKLAQHRGPANKLALLPDCPHTFLSGGEDGVVFSVDVRESKASKLLLQKDGDRKIALYSVDSNPVQCNMFCTSGRDQYIRIYDRRKVSPENSVPLKKFCPHHMIDSGASANVTCSVFSHDGSEVLGSYNDEDIYLFSSEHSDGADYRKRYQGHRNSATVKGVNFYGARSEFVISGSDCGNIFLWSKEKEAIVNMFEGDSKGVVNVLEPHPNLPFLATSGLDDEVKIWFPVSQTEVDKKNIEQTVIRNNGNRERRRMIEPDTFDGQMLWVLLRQIRRSEERRRRQNAAESGEADVDHDDSDEEESEGEHDSDEPSGGIQCPTS